MNKSILVADTIDFDKPLLPKWMHVVRDSLIFVTNWADNPPWLEIYHLESKELLVRGIPQGRGPGELLACVPIYPYGYDNIMVYDPVGSSLLVLELDSLLKYGENAGAKSTYKVPAFCRNPVLIDSNRVVGWNFYSFKYKDIDNGFDRLFMVDYSDQSVPSIDLGDNFYDAVNLSLGHVLVNTEKNVIMAADMFNAKIYIYNTDLEIIKELEGPDLFEIEYSVDHVSRRVRRLGGRYRTYYNYCYTNDAVYLIYFGAIGVTGFVGENPVEVFKISWEGDLLHRYQLDQPVNAISLDSNAEYLYATGVRGIREHPYLLRYKLK